jgi:hypothetical protein
MFMLIVMFRFISMFMFMFMADRTEQSAHYSKGRTAGTGEEWTRVLGTGIGGHR